ncbi:hypothetical protein D3C74_339150 [compost metagenome]
MYAPMYPTLSAFPMMRTNSAEVTAHDPMSPRSPHPATRIETATTSAIDSALGASTRSAPRATSAPTTIAPTAWKDSRTDLATVLVVATTAPSGA